MPIRARASILHLSVVAFCWILTTGAATTGAKPADRQSRIAGIRKVLGQFLQYNQQGALESPEARKLLTGEAAARWHTDSFGLLNGAPDAVVLTGPAQAVARVQWFGANRQVTDFYFYLKWQGGWKLSAMRYLSLTGIIEQAALELRAKSDRSPEEQVELANLELTLACDRELRRHFLAHRAQFDQLRRLAPPHGHPSPSAAPPSKLIEALHLDRVEARGGGEIGFLIGGVTDNSVGYLYCPSGRPPAITPSAYIWVEQIAPNWYLYRTT